MSQKDKFSKIQKTNFSKKDKFQSLPKDNLKGKRKSQLQAAHPLQVPLALQPAAVELGRQEAHRGRHWRHHPGGGRGAAGKGAHRRQRQRRKWEAGGALVVARERPAGAAFLREVEIERADYTAVLGPVLGFVRSCFGDRKPAASDGPLAARSRS